MMRLVCVGRSVSQFLDRAFKIQKFITRVVRMAME
jgi:hypothetical protein